MSFKLYAIRVFSFEWEKSLAFYRDTIGLPLLFESQEQSWAQFDLDGAYLGLERCDRSDPESSELVGRFVGTSIQVENIQSLYQEFRAKGVEFVDEPEQQPWGGTLAHFKDPDGNIITLLGDAA